MYIYIYVYIYIDIYRYVDRPSKPCDKGPQLIPEPALRVVGLIGAPSEGTPVGPVCLEDLGSLLNRGFSSNLGVGHWSVLTCLAPPVSKSLMILSGLLKGLCHSKVQDPYLFQKGLTGKGFQIHDPSEVSAPSVWPDPVQWLAQTDCVKISKRTVEPRNLEHDHPPAPKPRKEENRA